VIRIRAARPDDAGAMAAVHADAVALAYAGIFDAGEPPPTVDQLLGRWATRLATPQSWIGVLDIEGRVAGTIGVRPSPDDGAAARTGELVGLHVHPSQWGHGHGGRLIGRAQTEASSLGFGPLTLWVLEANVRARRMYVARGWRPDGTTRTVAGDVRELRYRLSPLV
jgi:GNAT superfamily N-acetyltransferase